MEPEGSLLCPQVWAIGLCCETVQPSLHIVFLQDTF
jgi:hypothetical protein